MSTTQKIMEFARDPMWQSIGVVLALAALALSYWIYRRQKERKRITFERISNVPLLTIKEEVAGRVSVTFDGQLARAIHMATVRIRNAGTTPILPADYLEPLTFNTSAGAKLLTADIVESDPVNLKPMVSVQGGRGVVEPLLLNPGDCFVVKMLIQDGGSKIEPEARVVGVRAIEKVLDPDSKYELQGLVGIFIGAIGNLVALGLRAPRMEAKTTPGEYVGYTIMACGFFLWAYSTLVRYWHKRKLGRSAGAA
ncbi:hypothetical protein [Piscinibacter sp. HJYY11]|uniref:hypothetical protein n=1 Tax=Piscinibacter sp. HJYY11 TaxID=2801333 RepID=UPI00191ECA74|nr:hypothetical protein [Piscinibacter sp. HJYY11]MBL0726274.1 hypothetical protein [Piscinibacter sp. HJYY11]